MIAVARLLWFTISTLLLGYSFGLELQSEELIYPQQLSTVIPYGKRLKLRVENVLYPELRWQFNGTFVSEKCEVKEIVAGSILTCPDLDWSDEGSYALQGVDARSGQVEILLAVKVKIVDCEKSAKQVADQVEIVREPKKGCFCSGITNKCEMADNLFRSKITGSLRDTDMVPSKWYNDGGSPSLKYYLLPKIFKGNLLNSYGGFLDIPPMDDGIDEDSPDIVLQGNNLTLVFNHKRELDSSMEQNRKRIQMTEHDWRHMDGSNVSKSAFMTVLTKVKEFYVKSYPSKASDPLRITLDSADTEDRGMGKVTTVEKCECRRGYVGLSCERCSDSYIRRYAIAEQGVCVPLKEIWTELKHPYNRRYENLHLLSRT